MIKQQYLYIISLVLISMNSFAQGNEWSIYHNDDNGSFNIESNDGDYKFSPGGRFTFDGGFFDQDITPLSAGTMVREMRINSAFKIKNINIFVDVDFAGSKVSMKDITLRYNFNPQSFLKVGHFVEPFAANYLTTTEIVPFVARPATASAFAPGRSLGLSYTYRNRYMWFSGGFFGNDKDQTYEGQDGYALTGRLVLIPVEIPNSHLHFAVSASHRTADSRGLDESGSGKYNRKLNFTAGLQTNIYTENLLAAYVGPSGSDSYGQTDLEDLENGGAKDQFQLAFEVMDIYRNFYWQAEFMHTRVNRIMNRDKILDLERDGGVFPETWEDISYKYGEARPLNFSGYYVQASYLLFGGNFKYNKYSSSISRLTKKSLQLSARYNYTSLNDIEGEYINGDFYTEKGKNLSFAGGKTKAFSVSLNYVFNSNLRFVAEYTNQTIDNFIAPDENINIYQARLQVVF